MFFLIPIILLLIPIICLDHYINRPPIKGIQAYKGLPFIGCLLEVQTLIDKDLKVPKNIDKSKLMLTRPIFMKFFKWNQSDTCVCLEEPELPIFQFRLGFNWILVVNNPNIYKDLIVKNSKKTDDRPLGESFHNIISDQNKVFTIGTTPKGADYNAIKNFSQKQFLTNSNLDQHFSKIIIHECRNFMKDVNESIVDPLPLLQKYVARISCWLCFGIDLNNALDKDYLGNDTSTSGTIQHGIVSEIVYIEREIVKLRNPMTNGLDHFPEFLKNIFYKKTIHKIDSIKSRRNKYINKLYDLSIENYKKRTSPTFQALEEEKVKLCDLNNNINNETIAFENCLITKFLNEDPELNKEHILTICLTMMSAGLDNISSLLNNIIHRLSQGTVDMQHLKKNCYEEIFFNQKRLIHEMNNSTDELIGNSEITYFNQRSEIDTHPRISNLYMIPPVDVQDKMDEFGRFLFIKSLMYENIRYLSVAPLGLPRMATDDIKLSVGVTIPKGTRIITNLYLMNHSHEEFNEPYKFNPYRFFKDERCPCDQCTLEKHLEHPEDGSLPTLAEPNYGKLRIFEKFFNEKEFHMKEKDKLCHINGFGKGSRVCLGERLAEYEMYYLLYYILAYYKLKSIKTTFVPFKQKIHNRWFSLFPDNNTNSVNIQETDPRINNSCLDGISIEQNWDCLVSFENRLDMRVREKPNSVVRRLRRSIETNLTEGSSSQARLPSSMSDGPRYISE
ncbi:hypothetical protein FOG51_01954 [Hanseniaspora uvarum]|nr:hypothetical protein FOG51_01954 [Hanseniaspora uvarum]